MQLMKPDPRILTVWRTRLLCLCVLFSLLAARFLSGGALLFAGLAAAVFIVLSFLWFPLYYRKINYKLDTSYFTLQSGVFYTKNRTVPFHAVQYAVLRSSPLEQRMSLCTLILYLAGGRLTISGLRVADAETIRQLVSRKNPDRRPPHA